MPTNRALNAFQEAVNAVEQSKFLYGFIGKLDSSASGGVVIDVPGRPGYVYVRISNGLDVQTVMEAYNQGGHRNPNVKVRIARREYGLVVEAPVAADAVAFLGERASELAVPPHSHAIGSGNVDMVEGRRFVPGSVRPATGEGEPGGLHVYVEAFHHPGGYWIGGTFLMTPPATSGKKAWCVVTLNPADDTLYQQTGADQPTTIPMAPLLIADIAIPTGYIPLGAVVLQNGQTSITGAETWDDCRYHFAQAGGEITNFVAIAPASDTRNTIQPAGDHPALILKNNASQTDAPFQVQTSAGAVMVQVSAAGGLTVNEQGADADTRIEGDTAANLLFVDASKDAVGINQGTIANSAVLDVASTTKGILIPRMTETERDAISSPATGLLIFNTTTGAFNFWDASQWTEVGTGTGGGGGGAPLVVTTEDHEVRELIHDETLTSSGSFESISIPSGYDHLEMVAVLRSTASAVADGVYLQFNGDTTDANYRSQASNTTNATAGGGYSDTARCGIATGSTAPADTFGQNQYLIASHSSTTKTKSASCIAVDRRSSTDISTRHEALNWESTAAITSVTLRTDNHSTDLFAAGSRLQIFGVKTTTVVTDVTGTAEYVAYSLCQGRLTLTSGTPVTTSDVTAATTVYFTPYKGNQIGLYSGSAWAMYTFTEKSLSLSGFTADKNYDIWAYDSGGSVTLDSTVWTNDTTRATALTTQDGVYVKSGATTRRYLGTIRITGTTGQTEDSEAKRYVWNYYNRANRRMALIDTSPTNWTYNSSTYRQANNSSDYRVQGVWGVAEDVVVVTVAVVAGRTGAATVGIVSIAEDSTTTPSHSVVLADQQNTPSGTYVTKRATLTKVPTAGYHYYQWMESVTLSTCEFYTDPNSAIETYGINGVYIG